MGDSTRRARCRVTAFDEVEIAFPYHADLVAALKDEIPYIHRSYDPTSKVWRVARPYWDVAIDLLTRFFPDAEIPHQARRPRDLLTERRQDDSFGILHLLPSAPRCVVDASYRALARALHPDVGGDEAKMRELNAAYDLLCRGLGA